MSYETAKNGPPWEHAPAIIRKPLKCRVEVEEKLASYPYRQTVEKVIRKVEPVLCCPDCGQVIKNEYGPLRDIKELGKRKHNCRNCHAALWRQVPAAVGGRVAIADFLNRHYSGQYNLIIDEAHHSKGADTDVGYASMDLIAGANKVLAMTGTIYGGKASSIFHLLFRLMPDFRRLYAYNEV